MTATPDSDVTRRVIDCATIVHRALGPGFSSDIYETCLTMEPHKAGLAYERGRMLTAIYDGHPVGYESRADVVVADWLLPRIEAVDEIELLHEQRPRTCLWMGGMPAGLLLNFNVVAMRDGISRIAAHVAGDQAFAPVGHDVFDDPDLGSAR